MDTHGDPTVLVVESDETARTILTTWLLSAGYVVMPCPGPLYPTYRCVAGRGHRCAIACGADVVLLDMQLASDWAMEGTSGHELLSYYLSENRRVIARVDADDPLRAAHPDGVLTMSKDASRAEVLDTVARALTPATVSR